MAHTAVLLVEDNQDMRRSLAQILDREGFAVSAVSSCEEGIDEVDEKQFAIAIIDINLPGKSGFELIEYIREQGQTMPLIAMTAREGIEDKIRGFDLGLTDYITKPFHMKELLARVAVHTKSQAQTDDDTIATDQFSLSPKRMAFSKKGKAIELTQLELRLMQTLMEHNHTLVPVDDLIQAAWGESDDMVAPPVRVHIANLRKKIGDSDYRIIRTIPGTGYIFSDPPQEDA